jgi:hypothetical protein
MIGLRTGDKIVYPCELRQEPLPDGRGSVSALIVYGKLQSRDRQGVVIQPRPCASWCISHKSRGVCDSSGRIASIPVGPMLFSRYFSSLN